MKKNIYFLFIFGVSVVLLGSNTVAQETKKENGNMDLPKQNGTVVNPSTQGQAMQAMNGIEDPKYSDLANELIRHLCPGAKDTKRTGKGQPQVIRPAVLSEEYCSQKYRQAWEELLLALVTKPTPTLKFIRPRIFEALDAMKDPESLPILMKAFKQTTEVKDVDKYWSLDWQEQILRIMVHTCDKKSLEAILDLMDFADETQVAMEWEKKQKGSTLRDVIFWLWMNPLLKENAWQQDWIKSSDKWQSLIKDYNNPKLSKKNQELLEKVKAFKRPAIEAEQKKTSLSLKAMPTPPPPAPK